MNEKYSLSDVHNLGTITNLNITTSSLIAGDIYTATFQPNATNAPVSGQGGRFFAFAQPNGNSWGEQLAISDGTIYTRKWNSSGYGNWVSVINSNDPYIKTAIVNVNLAKTYHSSANITAPTVSGYNFVCWVSSSTVGWISPTYIADTGQASTAVWNAGDNASAGTGNGTVQCRALYVRNQG